jgi:hypothetical protein
MSVGLAILITATMFAVLYLYSLTRDRWDWRRIAKWGGVATASLIMLPVVFLIYLLSEHTPAATIGFVLVAAVGIFCLYKVGGLSLVAVSAVAVVCAGGYFGYGKFQVWSKQQEVTRKEAREENARACNAAEIVRLEPILRRANEAVTDSMSLDQAKSILDPILGSTTDFLIPDSDIKKKRLIGKLNPKCDTAFYYSIKVQYNEYGTLEWFRVWAENAPKGYLPNTDRLDQVYFEIFGEERKLLKQFSTEYEEIRQDRARKAIAEQLMAEQLRRKIEADAEQRRKIVADAEQRRKIVADEENRRRAEKQSVLKNIVINNFSQKCALGDLKYINKCGWVKFSFFIKNNSNRTLSGISFGWDLYSAVSGPCPKQLSTKKEFNKNKFDRIDLAPGEARGFEFDSENVPENFRLYSDSCFRVTDVAYAN